MRHNENGSAAGRIPRWTWWLLVAAALWRLAYVAVQSGADPTLDRPAFDGAYYVDWARALAGGEGSPGGAFYLAPLYPYALSLVFRFFGDGLFVPMLIQQVAAVATAVVLSLGARKRLGSGAPLGASLFLLHQPLAFFASRPLSEALAVPLLLLALLALWGKTDRASGGAGLLAGLAVLARPNLLLVALVWIAGALCCGRRKQAALVLAGVLLVVLPVTVRNARVSGHAVLVSSNAGITLYHGNGPGAAGTYTAPPGFSGSVSEQRREATGLARLASGKPMDDVEADAWWRREALRARRADPPGTLGLLVRRLGLLLDSREIGLDYAPALDTNPLRLSWRFPPERDLPLVPLALLLALAALGFGACGLRRSGGWEGWGAVAACALTPLLFYMASRYRVPMAALLCLPAGRGLSVLLRLDKPRSGRSLRRSVAIALVIGLWSLGGYCLLARAQCRNWSTAGLSQGLSQRALAYREAGDLTRALRDAVRAAELAPRSALVRYNLGVVQGASGAPALAEESFLAATRLDPPGRAAAAGDLAQMWIAGGRAAEAIPLLREALEGSPAHAVCWNNLVVGLHQLGRREQARAALEKAQARGVRLHPELVDLVRSPGADAAGEIR